MSQLSCVSLLAVYNAANTDDSSVDGAGNAIGKLYVDLGHLEVSSVICVVLLNISL